MKIILGTGSKKTNESFEYHFQDHETIDFAGTIGFREGVEQIISRENPDVLILSDKLGGTMPIEELIKKLRTSPPFIRIVFLMTETDEILKRKLYTYSCYDVIDRNKEKVSIEDMENIILNPRKYEDIASELSEIDYYDNKGNIFERKYDINEKAINQEKYNHLNPNNTGKKPLHQKISVFWSTSDLSGKTFDAVNSSIFLANNPELKVLLLDFNVINPNVHLQFGTSHPTRNLSKLMEHYQQEEEVRPHILRDYLIKHPTYSNLSILPGDIAYHQNHYSTDDYFDLLNDIIEISSQMNYSTILIDLSSHFSHPINERILNLSHEILFHVNEYPSSLNATKYFFDPEKGPIIQKEISLEKIYTIINRTTEEFYENTKAVLDDLIPNNQIIARFNENQEISNGIISGEPALMNNNETLTRQFSSIGNVIHPGLFQNGKKIGKKGGKFFSLLK